MRIKDIRAIEILDSRGNPTLKTFVTVQDGTTGWAAVPSGASTGSHEALELRDGDAKRYLGRGVQKAVDNVNQLIAAQLVGQSVEGLEERDHQMIALDGTKNKSRLGANAILSVSLACARALATAKKLPLWQTINKHYFSGVKPTFPRLMVNVVNGGKHADWNFDIQEFMIVPSDNTPSTSIQKAAQIFHRLGRLLKAEGFSTLVGDEGGYSPALSSNDEVFEYLSQATRKAGYVMGKDVKVAIDAAASEFYRDGSYVLKKQNKRLTTDELEDYYRALSSKFNIMSFEDPFHEEDWDGFAKLTKALGNDALVVGDDLYATNPKRIQKGIAESATHAVLIKVNQIGTLSETVQAIRLCQDAGWKVIISHRSGETEDPFITDLAVACGADFLKAGSASRSERLAKYNRLLEIEALELK